jgi:calcineurin-like phosphoesterase family protein
MTLEGVGCQFFANWENVVYPIEIIYIYCDLTIKNWFSDN